jgi:hypothetical protein
METSRKNLNLRLSKTMILAFLIAVTLILTWPAVAVFCVHGAAWILCRLELSKETQEETRAAQDFLDSLVEAPFDAISGSDDMKVLRNIPNIEYGNGKVYDVILYPKSTAAFWDACIGTLNTPGMFFRIAVIGPFAMGKTICTPIVIRKLLEMGHSVVYLFRRSGKQGWYYKFVRRNGKFTAKAYPESIHPDGVPSLLEDSTYYIVDTDPYDQTKSNCNPPDDFRPKVIIVARPDSRFWGDSDFEKLRNNGQGFLKFIPLWSLEEILSAQPVLRPDMTREQVTARYHVFGGVPGIVFMPDEGAATMLEIQFRH